MYTPSEIVVPIDFSQPSLAATQRAMRIAAAFGAHVHLLHSVEDRLTGGYAESDIPRGLFDTLHDQARARMDAFVEDIAQAGVEITGEVSRIDPVSAIRAASKERSANLIVMGSRGLAEWKQLFLGSVAERTLHVAGCPVLIVKEEATAACEPIQRILFATDFSAHSRHAAHVARDLAKALGATVEVFHAFVPAPDVVAPYAVTPQTADLIAPLRAQARSLLGEVTIEFESAGIRVDSQLQDGFASSLIPREAEQIGADLIVMGTRGNTGLKHIFLGSVAERTLRGAHCSVLTTQEGDRL